MIVNLQGANGARAGRHPGSVPAPIRDTDQASAALAKSENDRRAALKKAVNQLLQSRIIEEKSYAPYGQPEN